MFLRESCDCITRRSSARDVFTFDCRPMFFFSGHAKENLFLSFLNWIMHSYTDKAARSSFLGQERASAQLEKPSLRGKQ